MGRAAFPGVRVGGAGGNALSARSGRVLSHLPKDGLLRSAPVSLRGPFPSPWSGAVERAIGPDALGHLPWGGGLMVNPPQSSTTALWFEWAKGMPSLGIGQSTATTFVLDPFSESWTPRPVRGPSLLP